MKKLHFLLGAAALTLAACSNDDVVDLAKNQEIGFSPFVDKSTRATDAEDLNTTNLQNTGFAVWGATWDDDKQAEGVTTIFKHQQVTYNATDGWTYAPLQYWIAGNEYRFSALAPYSATTNPNIMTVAQKLDYVSFDDAKGGIDITFDNKEAAANIDLCFAKAKLQNVAANQTPVQLTFSHLLSRVKFTFVNTFPSPKSVIQISNINIEDATAKATLNTFAGEEYWTEVTGVDPFIVNFAMIPLDDSNPHLIPGGTNTSQVHQQDSQHQYFLPLGTEKAYTVNFNVELFTYDEDTKTYNSMGKWDHKVTLPSIKFAPNASYNFIAKIDNTNINPEQQLFPIKFTASVTDWDSWTDKDVDLPAKPTE